MLKVPYNNLHTLETHNLDLSSDQINFPMTQLQRAIMQGGSKARDQRGNHVVQSYLSQINESKVLGCWVGN